MALLSHISKRTHLVTQTQKKRQHFVLHSSQSQKKILAMINTRSYAISFLFVSHFIFVMASFSISSAIYTKITLFWKKSTDWPSRKLFNPCNPFVWRPSHRRHTSLCGVRAGGTTCPSDVAQSTLMCAPL
jgi:hypothetical protein